MFGDFWLSVPLCVREFMFGEWHLLLQSVAQDCMDEEDHVTDLLDVGGLCSGSHDTYVTVLLFQG